MGIAEVIPGVSGGTIAFITGIYEKLLQSIQLILNPKTWLLLFKSGVKVFWTTINGSFLLPLLAGMISGLVFGIFVISYLLKTYPLIIWSFFFGLILASSFIMAFKVRKWNWIGFLLMGIGAAIAYGITILNPGEGNSSLGFIFLSGMIAICALVLPGISGSFILLLMGMYPLILGSAKSVLTDFSIDHLTILVMFGMGCLIGLAIFSRLLTYLLNNFHNYTLALLTGFMIGSLPKIWPWRYVREYRINSSGEQVPYLDEPVLPFDFSGDPMIIYCIISLLAGVGIVSIFSFFEKDSNPS